MHQFVWACVFCETRICCCGAVDCSGTIQKIYMRKIRWIQGREHAWICDRFQHLGTFDKILGHFRAQGSALTRNVSSSHGSKNLLQRAILYRHEMILLGREDCGPGPKKTICKNMMAFHIFLGMHQFVWARALCCIRCGCPAAVDCSGTAQKIHMRKIWWSQGCEHAWKYDRIHDPGMFDEHFRTSEPRGPR